jgi:arylsulfatase A-like enzyme
MDALDYSHISTPALDGLVARETPFTDAYIVGGAGQAVCMPSRAMFVSRRQTTVQLGR